jgi:predicted  nucleic acid-binding Zn-ribbon protein
MSITGQLYDLQELDLQIETDEQSLARLNSQLGENSVVVKAQNEFAAAQQHLEDLKKQQHTKEWEIDDLTNKIKSAEEQMYSGKVTNPKELTSLQQEVGILKPQCTKLEDDVLVLMEQIEQAETDITGKNGKLKEIEAEWQVQQQKVAADIELLKAALVKLKNERQELASEIEVGLVELYTNLKNRKGIAVARVERGICRGCQISLSAAEQQRARAGDMVQCGSCGRILFQP